MPEQLHETLARHAGSAKGHLRAALVVNHGIAPGCAETLAEDPQGYAEKISTFVSDVEEHLASQKT